MRSSKPSSDMEHLANVSGQGPDVFAVFGKAFLSEYLSKGFGTISKREIELLVLRSMLESKSNDKIDSILLDVDEAALSKELRIRTTRVHSMITDLRYRHRPTDDTLRKLLKTELARGEFDEKSGLVRVQIDDELLREYAKTVAKQHGIVDRGLDRTIIEMHSETFVAVSLDIMSDQFHDEVFRKIPRKALKGDKSSNWLVSKIVNYVAANAANQIVRTGVNEIIGMLKDGGVFDQVISLAKNAIEFAL
ncbi:MAG: hypothetical protein RL594_19 [Bacteroidota bacterium]